MTQTSVQEHNQAVLSSFEKGDIVRFLRRLISHFGIMEDGEHVIHFNKDKGRKASVQRDNFFEVCKNSKALKDNYLDNDFPPREKDEIVNIARSMIGKKGYNLLFNNCEHFVTYCRYNKRWSHQVVTATVALLFLFSFIAIIIIPVLIERCQEGKDQEPLLICQLRILTDRWEREHQAANQYPSANNSLCPAADTSLASQNYSAADKWKWKSSDGEKCVIQLVFKDESSMEGTLSCHL